MQACSTFKNIESVWTFQLEDVMIDTRYFLRRHVPANQSNHLTKFLGLEVPGSAAGKVKDILPTGAETSQVWVKSMKLTVADERMFLSFDKNNGRRRKKAGPGRPPKEGGPTSKRAKM